MAPKPESPGRFLTADGERDAPARALVVVAHPDDIDFGTAGTMATLVAAGTQVTYCLATSGEAGGDDRGQSRADMASVREAEQRAAGAAVGVTDVRFLGHPDGRVEASLDLRRDISRVIRQVCPDVVFGQSPERSWDSMYRSHPDHLAVGEATFAAVYPDSRNPFAFPELLNDEGLEPHTVQELWVAGGPSPDRAVDITDVFDRKVDALSAHTSQTGWIEDLRGLLQNWSAETAERHGLPSGRLAEAFRVVATA